MRRPAGLPVPARCLARVPGALPGSGPPRRLAPLLDLSPFHGSCRMAMFLLCRELRLSHRPGRYSTVSRLTRPKRCGDTSDRSPTPWQAMTLDDRVPGDTVPFRRHWRLWAWAVAGSLALARIASAEPRELEASVVWTRADLVYIAAPDSGVLLPGMALSLFRGSREVARADLFEL